MNRDVLRILGGSIHEHGSLIFGMVPSVNPRGETPRESLCSFSLCARHRSPSPRRDQPLGEALPTSAR